MWEYSDIVKEHFKNPKNVGEMENPDAVGEAGSLACGDKLKLYLKIENDKIVDAKFQTFGCGSAVASSSILTEMVIGKTVEEAKQITNKQIADLLGGLPPAKMHCSVMGREALEDAIKNFESKGLESYEAHEITVPEEKPELKSAREKADENKIVCNCFDISKRAIIDAIKEGAKTIEQITEATYAGGGCRRCWEQMQEILDKQLAEQDNK